ncbi:unnamed protein product [Prorocentrum cordatum]|uniref:Uncharacterized protein n=1 Tax=Prorocentrum cordatum TaxID=2364126 RepID=A0ABN9U4G8_9DINO|nr:unnamed protein product [Polarella glacialis]
MSLPPWLMLHRPCFWLRWMPSRRCSSRASRWTEAIATLAPSTAKPISGFGSRLACRRLKITATMVLEMVALLVMSKMKVAVMLISVGLSLIARLMVVHLTMLVLIVGVSAAMVVVEAFLAPVTPGTTGAIRTRGLRLPPSVR